MEENHIGEGELRQSLMEEQAICYFQERNEWEEWRCEPDFLFQARAVYFKQAS